VCRRPRPGPGRIPQPLLLLGLVLLLFVSLVCGVGLGAAGIGTADMFRFLWAGATGGTVRATDAAACTIVWEIRLPRVVLAAVVGAGLSAVGVAVQAMVRNALADPFVLGISSGAAVGADAVILLGAFAGLGVWALSASAFASALAAMVLVYAVARSPQGLTQLWADVLSRLLLAPAELPVGVITAVVGVPAFLLVMRRGGYAFGGR
jgi:iron complex transport system permease protein